MEPCQNEQPLSQQKPFAPFLASSFQIKGEKGIYYGASSYNEKHNMIIACPYDASLQFYNATTFLPSEGFETEQLDSSVHVMSFWPETETYLLGCILGNIYTYNLSKKILKKIQSQTESHIIAITFLNSKYYAFSDCDSYQLSLGNLENGELLRFNLVGFETLGLCCFAKRKLLVSILSSNSRGSLRIYRTDQLPKLPVISSIQGFSYEGEIASRQIQSMTINGKEYLITAGYDFPLRIWHFSKGKIKLLKVIQMGERSHDVAYLENYKMLATTYKGLELRFLKFPSGRLESSVYLLNQQLCLGIFLILDKNILGVPSYSENKINIVKFSS